MSLILEVKEKGEIHVLTKGTSFRGDEIRRRESMAYQVKFPNMF